MVWVPRLVLGWIRFTQRTPGGSSHSLSRVRHLHSFSFFSHRVLNPRVRFACSTEFAEGLTRRGRGPFPRFYRFSHRSSIVLSSRATRRYRPPLAAAPPTPSPHPRPATVSTTTKPGNEEKKTKMPRLRNHPFTPRLDRVSGHTRELAYLHQDALPGRGVLALRNHQTEV